MNVPPVYLLTSVPIFPASVFNTHFVWLIFIPLSLSVCVTSAVSVPPISTAVPLNFIVAVGTISSLTSIFAYFPLLVPSYSLAYIMSPFTNPVIVFSFTPDASLVQLPSLIPFFCHSIW